jgi:hypothetical protein
MTQTDQTAITRQLDALWIISLFAAIHTGEPPDGPIKDEGALKQAVALASYLSDVYGGEDSPETIARRLADLGIGVEITDGDGTVRISEAPDGFDAREGRHARPMTCLPPCSPPCVNGKNCPTCTLFISI